MTISRLWLAVICVLMAVSGTYGRPTGDEADSISIIPSGGNQSVGLVLSGGGSKGIAHIGVIQALEENDIPIDYITGTSMGAIVGGLYAAGYTPQEMMSLLLSRGFSYWSTGQIDPDLVFYLYKGKITPNIFTLPISRKDSSSRAKTPPESLISPLPMTFAFMDLFSAYTAQCGGDFNRLFVPFKCVASDVEARHKMVLDSGNFGDAIRASMSFPAVFQPTRINGRLLYDGGIYDNYPIGVMRRDFAPSIMIGSNVSSMSTANTSIIDQMENMIMQKQSYHMPPRDGINIRFDLDRFGLLDFPAARQIYAIGYKRAMEMMDSIKSRIHTRMPMESRRLARDVFKSHTPYLRFDSVEVKGGTPGQNRYLRYLFRKPPQCDTFGIEHARMAYYQAISSGKIKDLDPQAEYNDSTGLFKLKLNATLKDNLSVGLGGYITSSNNNYLYLSGNFSTLSFNSIGASIGAWIGQSYLAGEASGRFFLKTGIPSYLSAQIVAARQKFYESEYLFYEDKLPAFILDTEVFGKMRWSLAAGRNGRLDIGAGAAHIYQSFFNDNSAVSYYTGKDRVKYNLASAFIEYENYTLDDINFPTAGHSYRATGMAVKGRYRLEAPGPENVIEQKTHPKWLQIEMATRNYLSLGSKWKIGLESDVILSTRKLHRSYTSSLVGAPSYNPTPASNHTFNPAFRANSFIAGGIVPVYKYNESLSARLNINCFLPLRKISRDPDTDIARYGRWLSDPKFFSELDVVYRFPMVSLSGYCNFASYPSKNWNVGLAVGIFILAPKFLK